MSTIYLDNAATTKVRDEIVDTMSSIIKNEYGNPSSTHSYGRSSKSIVELSRKEISNILNVKSSEIIFTSGGTEGDNMIIRNCVNNLDVRHIITSKIEHHAVGHTAMNLKNVEGIKISYVKIDKKGNVDLKDLERLLQEKDKTLVSLMHANNEIATLLPIKKVSELCRKYNALFHSDTVQTMAHYSFNLDELDIDYITCAGHKFHGPKGTGFLYVNKKVILESFIHGGSQERGLRGGTENVAVIVGLSKAMDLAYENLNQHQKHVQTLTILSLAFYYNIGQYLAYFTNLCVRFRSI